MNGLPAQCALLSASFFASLRQKLAVRRGTNDHKGLIHANVWHHQGQEGHQHKPGRAQPLHNACHLKRIGLDT